MPRRYSLHPSSQQAIRIVDQHAKLILHAGQTTTFRSSAAEPRKDTTVRLDDEEACMGGQSKKFQALDQGGPGEEQLREAMVWARAAIGTILLSIVCTRTHEKAVLDIRPKLAVSIMLPREDESPPCSATDGACVGAAADERASFGPGSLRSSSNLLLPPLPHPKSSEFANLCRK